MDVIGVSVCVYVYCVLCASFVISLNSILHVQKSLYVPMTYAIWIPTKD